MTSITAQALIFDLDGTLISSIGVTESVYTKVSGEHNVDASAVVGFCHGVPTLQVLRKFFPETTHTSEYADQLERECAAQLDGISAIHGTPQLLQSIPNGKWGVFTSGMPFLAVPRMEYLKLPVPKVFITPVDISNGKPSPDGYLLAAAQLKVDPTQSVVLEDAVAGIQAGVAAGAIVIGVRTHQSADKLIAAGATYTVRDMSCITVEERADGLLVVTIDES